jgi:hypothetical protein
MVLGDFISGLVGIALERRRERKRTELKHFNVLKSKVLKPVLNELAELKSYFMFGEGRPISSLQRLDEELNSEFTWWKYYSLVDRVRVNRDLFEDLKNHFPKLYNDLKYVESWMRTKYPEYLHLLRDLLEHIENDPFLGRWRFIVTHICWFQTLHHLLLNGLPKPPHRSGSHLVA